MFASWLQRCCQLCSRHKSAFPGENQNMSTWPLQMCFYCLCLSQFGISEIMLLYPESRWECRGFVSRVKQALSIKSGACLLRWTLSWPLQVKGQTTVRFMSSCRHTNQQLISIRFLKWRKSVYTIQFKLLLFVVGMCCSASVCFPQC